MTDAEAPVEQVLEALRLWSGAFGDFGRRFGADAGMHSTDAEALIQIVNAEDRGAALTQSELSRRIGLTSGATSSLLNRLETAGHIERVRDRADRRMVTLRSTPAVHRRVDDFFAAVGAELRASVAARPPAVRAQVVDLLTEMTGVMDRHLAAPAG